MPLEFEDGSPLVNRNPIYNPRIIDFLIKKGIVKNANQALKVLLTVALIFIALSLFFFWYAYKKSVISPNDPRFKFTEEQLVHFPIQIQEQLRANGKVR